MKKRIKFSSYIYIPSSNASNVCSQTLVTKQCLLSIAVQLVRGANTLLIKRFKLDVSLFVVWSLTLYLILVCFSHDVCADSKHSKVAEGSEVAAASEVEKYGMTPIYGRDIKDGVYKVDVESSSSFFKIIDAKLLVEKEEMHAELVLSSGSYLLLYMGTGDEAAAADYSEYIEIKNKGGMHTVTVPVEALNKGLDCAAFSKNKEKWYNRKIMFSASSLPQEALNFPLPDYDLINDAVEAYNPDVILDKKNNKLKTDSVLSQNEAVQVDYADGEYSIDVDMTGGSGRANVSSPTLLIVKDGKAYAKLLWSSPNYDYMVVGGETYLNETKDGGNSTFTIPIVDMDKAIPVIADTTSMGDPIAIEYSLTFYQESIGEKGLIPQEAAKSVLVVALIIIVIGFILNLFMNRYRGEKNKKRK